LASRLCPNGASLNRSGIPQRRHLARLVVYCQQAIRERLSPSQLLVAQQRCLRGAPAFGLFGLDVGDAAVEVHERKGTDREGEYDDEGHGDERNDFTDDPSHRFVVLALRCLALAVHGFSVPQCLVHLHLLQQMLLAYVA
jgi:hypothetical protein